MTTRLAVWGSPIDHSRSPLLHSTAYAALGLDWDYSRQDVLAQDLHSRLDELDSRWRGLSLTMPLKGAAARLADELDDVAQLTGAVNTLLLTGGVSGPRRAGFNTDVAGIVGALAGVGLHQVDHAVILGAGATASSAVVACSGLGARKVSVLTRRPSTAGECVRLGQSLGVDVQVHAFDRSTDVSEDHDVLISTLPGGVSLPLEWDPRVIATTTLLDVAYDPWPSPLAEMWQAHGGTATNGLSMLVHQALVQVRIFVSGDPATELTRERDVLTKMLAAVSLDANGLPV